MKKNLVGIFVVALTMILCGCRAGGQFRYGEGTHPTDVNENDRPLLIDEAVPYEAPIVMEAPPATAPQATGVTGPAAPSAPQEAALGQPAPVATGNVDSNFDTVISIAPESFGSISKFVADITFEGKLNNGKFENWLVVFKEKEGASNPMKEGLVYDWPEFQVIKQVGLMYAGQKDVITKIVAKDLIVTTKLETAVSDEILKEAIQTVKLVSFQIESYVTAQQTTQQQTMQLTTDSSVQVK